MIQTCKSLPKYDVAFDDIIGSGHCKKFENYLARHRRGDVFDNKAETID